MKKNTIYRVFLVFLSVSAQPLLFSMSPDGNRVGASRSEKIVFDKVLLDDNAIAQGFGYKASNLIELKKFCEHYNRRENLGYQVLVPDFLPISSAIVIEQLAHVGFSIAQRWGDVIATQEEGKRDAFSADFLVARQLFEDDLSNALDRLSFNHSSISATINNFIETAARNNAFLMVRSTGKEDSDAIANAGGNESVANVQPSSQALIQAIKEVVLSYFSLKSLTQRLALGDPTVFSPEIFVPVLLQQMIREELRDKQLLVSGVLFTQDPECGEAAGGASIIQSAYGHGEGVVNGLVPVDTFYTVTLPDGGVATYPVLRKKAARRAGLVDGKLGTVPNDKIAAATPSLSVKELKQLHKFGRALEDYYAYPLDIEFVLKNNQFFIVQARPIVHKKSEQMPSYVQEDAQVERIKGICIGMAGGFVREINQSNEVLFCATLGDALRKYLAPRFDRSALKSVVVGVMAPSTSHEATTFRSLAIPVLCIPDFEKGQIALRENKKLLVDPQQGQLVVLEQGDEYAAFMQQGWAGYPAPRMVSLAQSYFEQQGDGFNQDSRVTKEHLKFAEILDGLKHASPNQAARLVAQFQAELASLGKNVTDVELGRTYTTLLNIAAVLCEHVVACAKNDGCFMRKLLAIRMLEALVYQQDQTVILQNSVAQVHNVAHEEKEISVAIPESIPESARGLFVQLNKISTIIGNDDLQVQWREFIEQVAHDKKLLKPLASLTGELAALEILPAWIQTWGGRYLSSDESCEAVISQWVHDFNQDKDYLKKLQEHMNKLKQLPIDAFADPERSTSAWVLLQESLDYFMSPEFVVFRSNSDKSRESFARLAAVQALRIFVDVYDRALKGANEQKNIALFKNMLQKNLALLEAFVDLLTPEEGDCLYVPEDSDQLHTKEAYLAMMRELVNKEFTEDDFLPTSGLDVAIFAMGSGYDFAHDRKAGTTTQPANGADVFSIMHQSLLNYCGVLAFNDAQKLVRPGKLAEMESSINKITHNSNTAKLVGFEATAQGLRLCYNLPLNSHSCQITLDYCNKTEEVSVLMHFCGGYIIERCRWYKGAAFTACLEALNHLETVTVHLKNLSNHELILSLSTKEKISQVREYIDTMIRIATQASPKVSQYLHFSIKRRLQDAAIAAKVIMLLTRFDIIGYEALLSVMENFDKGKLTTLRKKYLNEYIELIIQRGDAYPELEAELKELIQGHIEIPTIIEMVEKLLATKNSNLIDYAYCFLAELVAVRQAQDLAVKAIEDDAQNDAIDLTPGRFYLYEQLIEENRSIDAIKSIVLAALMNPNNGHTENAYELLGKLFDIGSVLSADGEMVASQAANNSNFSLNFYSRQLFRMLIKVGVGLVSIKTIVERDLSNTNKDSRDNAYALFISLFEVGSFSLVDAKNLATEAATDQDFTLSYYSHQLFDKLLQKCVAAQTIKNIAEKALLDSNKEARNYAYDLLVTLVELHNFSAEELVRRAADDDNFILGDSSLRLFQSLANQGIASDSIKYIAQKSSSNDLEHARSCGKKLLEKLQELKKLKKTKPSHFH